MHQDNGSQRKISRRRFLSITALGAGSSVLAACGAQRTTAPPNGAAGAPTASGGAAVAGGTYTIGTIVKIAGINWFNRMDEGVQQFAAETGHTAFLKGPEKADAALQIPLIEDLIAQKANAITVVPMSPEALEPVLKKAMDSGIKVVTHEASNQQNMHVDIEAFDNTAYGAHLMDHLARFMGEEGEYAAFVGSLTSKTHNEWADGGIARQKEAYPNMKQVVDKQETFDDSQRAYEKTKEILRAHPNIKGFQGSASTDVAGIGQAIEEAGLVGKVFVVGTSLPSIAGNLIESGAVNLISFWDPKLAGIAMNQLAVMLIEGQEITDGMGLDLTGYESMTLKGKVLYGSAWVDVTTENLSEYNF
ncbi:MAG: substrate-binding domain-containing protein [Chloroflexales bacterium]|nr:substrate-binding domain-containing protein [Chloroflexales bacterium]